MVNYALVSCSNECGSVASVDDIHARLEGEVFQFLPSLVLLLGACMTGNKVKVYEESKTTIKL